MSDNVLALGPFLGSWEEEILTFRPHMEWIKRSVPHKDVYISSHYNRSFLYEDKFIPIYSFLTRTELKQNGYIHEDIDQSDYNKILRKFKADVAKDSGESKKNIDSYALPYVKFNSPVSIYQKVFTRIPYTQTSSNIVFIPEHVFNRQKTLKIMKFLIKNYNAISIGDLTCHAPELNLLLTERLDYTENGFKEIINIISSARAVVTSCSFWTALCNMQNVPVFSWGDNLGQYKEGGIYNFGNKKCKTMYYSKSDKIDKLYNQISYFLEDL